MLQSPTKPTHDDFLDLRLGQCFPPEFIDEIAAPGHNIAQRSLRVIVIGRLRRNQCHAASGKHTVFKGAKGPIAALHRINAEAGDREKYAKRGSRR